MANHDPLPMQRTAPGWGNADPGRGDPPWPDAPRPAPRPGAPRHRAPQHGGERPGAPAPGAGEPRSGGADGNERLTALTGAVLLVLLAAEGFTILGIHQLITAHFFIGMLLLGPVTLKLGSTIYRFTRYYTGSAPYRRKGPPAPLLRLLGPVVIAATVGVFGSGIMLAVAGPGNGPWLFLHKGSFVVWFGAMSIHVLYYLGRVPRLIAADFRNRRAAASAVPAPVTRGPAGYGGAGYRPGYAGAAHNGPGYGGRPGYGGPGYGSAGYQRAVEILGGRGVRLALLVASLLGGLAIAMLTVHLAAPWHFILPGR